MVSALGFQILSLSLILAGSFLLSLFGLSHQFNSVLCVHLFLMTSLPLTDVRTYTTASSVNPHGEDDTTPVPLNNEC